MLKKITESIFFNIGSVLLVGCLLYWTYEGEANKTTYIFIAMILLNIVFILIKLRNKNMHVLIYSPPGHGKTAQSYEELQRAIKERDEDKNASK